MLIDNKSSKNYNVLVQYYLSCSNISDNILKIKKLSGIIVASSTSAIPMSLSEIGEIIGKSEDEVLEIVNDVYLKMMTTGLNRKTIFVTSPALVQLLKFKVGTNKDNIVGKLIMQYLDKNNNNDDLPSNELNMLGWVVNDIVTKLVGKNLASLKKVVKRMEDSKKYEGTIEESAPKYVLPIQDFMDLSDLLDSLCGVVKDTKYQRLINIIIGLKSAGADKAQFDLDEFDVCRVNDISMNRYVYSLGKVKKQDNFSKATVEFVYDCDYSSSVGEQHINLKRQNYLILVNRMITQNYKSVKDFITDVVGLSLENTGKYFLQSGKYSSNTPIISKVNLEELSDESVDELGRLGASQFIGHYYRLDDTGGMDVLNVIPNNKSLLKMTKLSKFRSIYYELDFGLKQNQNSWVDMATLVDEYENNSIRINTEYSSLIDQYNQYRYLKYTDERVIPFAQNQETPLNIVFNISELNKLAELVEVLKNPTETNIYDYTGILTKFVLTTEDLYSAMCKLYDSTTRYNLNLLLDDLSDKISQVLEIYNMYSDTRFKEYNLIFPILYDDIVSEIRKSLTKLYLGRNITNTMMNKVGEAASYIIRLVLSSNILLNYIFKESSCFACDGVKDISEDIEKAIVSNDVVNILTKYKDAIGINSEVDVRYALGKDYFYRSYDTGKLIITYIDENKVYVHNRINENLTFKLNNEGEWECGR